MNNNKDIHLSWRKDHGIQLVAYDMLNGRLILEIMDYAAHLAEREHLDSKTIINEIGLLKTLFEFILPSNRLDAIDEKLLSSYRESELKNTLESKISRGDEPTAKRTVNMKLRRIYYFLLWCQETKRLKDGTIGPFNCKVTASFNVRGRKSQKTQTLIRHSQNFPLLYRKATAGIGPRDRYFATEADRLSLIEYFANNGTSYTFARNVLLMDIADCRGWRRGSINSLRCQQFELASAKEDSSSSIYVAPDRQKFSYAWFFEIEEDLANRIRSFIQIERSQLLAEMEWKEDRTQDRIFLSAKDGMPLTDQAISRIFGMAFKAIGRPKGSGLHSFRRKFVERKVEEELKIRLRLGMDTSAASVAASVAVELGHANPSSLTSYVSRSQSRLIRSGGDTGGL